jgi:DNA-binding NarL/FixJ family response regulator
MTNLSPRQREIVELVGRDGLSWKAVTRTLDIHISTVKNHVAAIRERTGCERTPREMLTELYWSGALNGHGPHGPSSE